MKTPLLVTLLSSLLGFSGAALGAPQTLRVYNWSDYISDQTIPQFEKATGIKVKYDVYDSNDTLQAKLLAGKIGYDIVVPSSNFMAKQIQAGLFQKLDKSKIPNLANLDPNLLKLLEPADPGNQYGIPWAWITTGIGINVNKVKAALGNDAPLDSWELFFNPKYLSKLKSCGVSVLDAPSDVMPPALHYLGKDPNSKNPADYQAAAAMLKKIRPYITQFNSSGYINDLANGDVCIVLGWSGDIHNARRRAEEAKKPYKISYILPKSGAAIGFDMMVIPKGAPNPSAATQWVNFIQKPEVNAEITNKVFYATANLAAKKYVKPEIANDPTIYPPPSVVKNLFVQQPLPAEIMRLENRLWTQLKTGH